MPLRRRRGQGGHPRPPEAALTTPPVLRASSTDRAMLAMNSRGGMPEQIGVLLLLESAGALDATGLRTVLEQRTRSVPRLRRRLIRAPCGCGGPIWVDDPGFDIRRHVSESTVAEGANDQQLYDLALAAVTTPLPWSAPLWRAVLVTGRGGGRAGLVIVMHHVLSDGLGGLAMLAGLVDPGAPSVEIPTVAPMPARGALLAQAWLDRWQAIRGIRHRCGDVRRSMTAGGGWRPPKAAPCSLLRPTGPRRQIAVVTADLCPLRAAAHRQGATVNDAILVTTGAALARVLAARGEAIDPLVVVVPVSGRRGETDAESGNLVAPMLVPVPTSGSVEDRLARVARQVRAQRALALGPPPIATLGWLFRPLAAVGAYRGYLRHQRRFHTLVTNVRGPQATVCLDGARVTNAVPMSVGDNGNVTVHFSVMSYAGTLTIAIIVDPECFAQIDILAEALREELGHLCGPLPPGPVRQDG